MAIQVECGACGRQFRVKEHFAGTRLKCPHCQHEMLVAGPHVHGHDAFISYSTKDKQVADAACAALESKHLRCWIAPRDIPAGASWGAAIIEGIEDSRVLVLVFSANASASDQVLREVERAVAKKVPVVPLRIDRAEMSKGFEYFLGACHWLDATEGALESHLAQLSSTVRTMLLDRAGDENGRRPAPAAAARTNGPGRAAAAARVASQAAGRPPAADEPPARSRRTVFATLLALVVTAGGIAGGLYVASHPGVLASHLPTTTAPSPTTRPATRPTPAPGASTRPAQPGRAGFRAGGPGGRAGRGQGGTGPRAADDAGWVDLFDGKNLNGWEPSVKSDWKIEDGALVGGPGIGRLTTAREDYADFLLRVEAMIADGAGSGVIFHTTAGKRMVTGYKIIINANAPEGGRTGSLLKDDTDAGRWFPLVMVDKSPVPPGKWFTLEAAVKGNHTRVLVDGAVVADYDDADPRLRRGGIALIQAHTGSYVRFRKVQVRELPQATEK